jgi:ERCC4-related helicase
MDGYTFDNNDEIVEKYLQMQELFDHQVKLSQELVEVSEELKTIPEMPKDLEKWIDSIPNEKSKFKLTDYDKLFKISKRYNKLVEKREENSQKIKIFVIDNLIDRINEILGK